MSRAWDGDGQHRVARTASGGHDVCSSLACLAGRVSIIFFAQGKVLSSTGASRQLDATTHTARAALTILCRGDCLAKYTSCPPRICSTKVGG